MLEQTYIVPFRSKCIGGIFALDRKKVPAHWTPAPILERDTVANITTMLSRKAPIYEQYKHKSTRATKPITVPAGTELQVDILESKCGLMTIEPIKKT